MYPDDFTPAPLASIAALKKYGVQRSTALYFRNNFWDIPLRSLELFSTRYLLKWEAAHVRHQIEAGTIQRKGVTYQVIYYRTDPVAVKKHTGKVLLSFRALDEVYGASPVVLITIA